MIAWTAVALSLFGLMGHGPQGPKPPRPAVQTARVDGWTIRARYDPFTGQTACAISKGRADYQRGVVVLRMGRDVDTSAADVRVDGGASRNVRDIVLPGRSQNYDHLTVALFNPSEGEVALPEDDVLNARKVWIRSGRTAAYHRIDVSGLPAALALAPQKGC